MESKQQNQKLSPVPQSGLRSSANPQTVTEGFGVTSAIQSAELAAVAVAASAKAEVEAAYIMAMKRPRSEESARIKIMNVCKNPIFADKAKYSKPVGKKNIVGPSIRMAEEILRSWGNVLVQQSAIFDNPEKRIVKIIVKDLESNLSFSTEITVEKKVERRSAKGREVIGERVNSHGQKVSIVVATEDELLVKEAALVSKSIRNNGLRLIPEHVIEEALATVDATLKDKVNRNPNEEGMRIAAAFAEVGVIPADLEKYLGHTLRQSCPAEIVDLRAIYTSIKEGQARWSDFIGEKQKEKQEPARGSMDDFGAGDPKTHKSVTEPVGQPQNKGVANKKTSTTTNKKIGVGQKRMLEALISKSALSREDFKDALNIESLNDLLMGQMDDALNLIKDNQLPEEEEREPGQEG